MQLHEGLLMRLHNKMPLTPRQQQIELERNKYAFREYSSFSSNNRWQLGLQPQSGPLLDKILEVAAVPL